MPVIPTNPVTTAQAKGSNKPFFNGTTMEAPAPLTPEQTRAQQQAQDRFSGTTRSVVDELLNLQTAQTKEQTDAEAAGLTAKGYGKEADAYENAALTSEESAHLAEVSGHLQAYQDMRKYQVTAGSQVAQVSGNGFKEAGSALYIAKSGFQQAQLTRQLDVLNGTEKSIGYLETAAASRAQGSAAGAARDAALALQKSNTDAAATTGANVSNLSTAMKQYFSTVDPSSVTPEAQLSLGLLGDNPDQALSDTANKLSSTANTTWDAAAKAAAGGAAGPFNLGTSHFAGF